jgi:hypothetical protein
MFAFRSRNRMVKVKQQVKLTGFPVLPPVFQMSLKARKSAGVCFYSAGCLTVSELMPLV